MRTNKVYIVGAGVSGLIAAYELEQKGIVPTIIEASDSIGGRVKTTLLDQYQLDRGFQVMLDAYPQSQKYLDYDALELQKFLPGAVIFKDGKQHTLGDPLRSIQLLVPTLKASIGTLKDKFLILKLNRQLHRKTLDQIFGEPEHTTLAYLQDYGFSKGIIADFFTPFFGSIYLEPDLNTSSRMFEFVFKMFGEGYATLPKEGIGAISKQLGNSLANTEIRLNTPVEQVVGSKITLKNGEVLEGEAVIIATEASSLVNNLREQQVEWNSCDNFYFETSARVIDKALIGLVADKEALISNLFYHNSLETASKGLGELLSVTVIKSHQLDDEALLARVTADLKRFCGIRPRRFIKHIKINKGLPKLQGLAHTIAPTETKLAHSVFLAGDHLLNGSLNAAMTSGAQAAQGVIQQLQGGTIVG